SNLMNLNEGVTVANEGDSSQFMFVSRAILAGFNSSNVDVRSSRYDTIIDYEDTLLKVQVKGISGDSKIYFKDRPRGGQGIDYTHERNQGKIITTKDCDIYVAVDKQCGLCYIIPMNEIDRLTIKEKENGKNVKELSQYLENWNIIKDVATWKNTNRYTTNRKKTRRKNANNKNIRRKNISRSLKKRIVR
ncbi:group I intron-associated PD-(D/E)XK endonuclease, partial [Bacillus sp. 7884-1]|uniref:group I intron-associated PD-(D/E)XK endonuclease n=1 Tax=Bacillus sp. 7884-1 TaxID=2021693 RepID=UPI000BC95BCE